VIQPVVDAAPVVQTIEATLALESLADFDADKYIESVASSAGIDVNSVQVESVDYAISSTYAFPPGTVIDEKQCVSAIATAFDVDESVVTCEVASQRRLAAFLSVGRRLQDGVPVTVIIRTTDLEVAKRAQESATDTATISSKLSEATGAIIEEPIVSVAPSVTIKVTTKIISTDGAVSAPSAKDLASAYERRTGKAVKVSVEVLASARTTTTPNSDKSAEDVPNGASHTSLFPTMVLSMATLIVVPLWCDKA